MNQAIIQSLAGCVALLTLLPLSLQELKAANLISKTIDEAVYTGGYPDLYAGRTLSARDFTLSIQKRTLNAMYDGLLM